MNATTLPLRFATAAPRRVSIASSFGLVLAAVCLLASAARAQTPAGMSLIDSAGKSFHMGDSKNELPNESWPAFETPVRRVIFTKSFYLGQTEVTYAKWKEVRDWALTHGYSEMPVGQIGTIASTGLGRSDTPANRQHPVTNITWYDAVKWCNARSEMEGLPPCYLLQSDGSVYRTAFYAVDCNWEASGYRLPTTAEWEYAARGGVDDGRRFPWGDEPATHSRANYRSNWDAAHTYTYDQSPTSGYHPLYNGTAPVGSFPPTGFGLFDMVGNIHEWCWDKFPTSGTFTNRPDPETDPHGDSRGSLYRDWRGGGYANSALLLRCSSMDSYSPSETTGNFGFRVARTILATATGFTVQPVDRAGPIGGSASFTVTTSGSPAPTCLWQRKPAGSSTWADLSDGNGYGGVATSTLTVALSSTAQTGDQFCCVATNPAGSATSDAATLTVNKGTATVTLGSLTRTYDGAAQIATATTTPAGLLVSLTYDGSATAPVNAGSYAVVVTIEDATYAGTASGTLLVAKAAATVVLGGATSHTYDGTAKSLTASTNPAGLATTVTYAGSATPPTLAGSYVVEAVVEDLNYDGSVGGTLIIRPVVTSGQPSAVTSTAGGATMLSVSASGTSQPTYQWQFEVPSAGTWTDIPGATGASYTIPSTQRFHARSYRAVVTENGASTESAPVAVAVEAAALSASRLLNLSTRALCLTGDNRLIPGFVIVGSGTKKILVRAVGPTLAGWGVTGTLPDPQLVLKHHVGAGWEDINLNDDWGANTNAAEIAAAAARTGAFPLAPGSADAAVLVDLAPGLYSVVNEDATGCTGVAMVELYDADEGASTAQLVNISNRGWVGTGGDVMIPGFVVSEEGPKTFLVRAVGPALAGWGLTGLLEDPQTAVHRSVNAVDEEILSNDNWGENGDADTTEQIAAQVGAFALTRGSKDAAFVVTLPPGVYSVVTRGVGATTGVAMVEVYVVE